MIGVHRPEVAQPLQRFRLEGVMEEHRVVGCAEGSDADRAEEEGDVVESVLEDFLD